MKLIKSKVSYLLRFRNLYSLLGKNLYDPDVCKLLEYIKNELCSEFVIHEPMPEDIKDDKDKWKVYDYQKLGMFFEIVNDTVEKISFGGGLLQKESVQYPYDLYKGLNAKLSRDEVHKICGNPFYSKNCLEYYNITDEIIMDVIYNDQSWKIILIEFGIHDSFDEVARKAKAG